MIVITQVGGISERRPAPPREDNIKLRGARETHVHIAGPQQARPLLARKTWLKPCIRVILCV
jgi:hypothetical protein